MRPTPISMSISAVSMLSVLMTVCGFIAEPVMGAAACVSPPEGYFEEIQAVLKRHDVLFIAD